MPFQSDFGFLPNELRDVVFILRGTGFIEASTYRRNTGASSAKPVRFLYPLAIPPRPLV